MLNNIQRNYFIPCKQPSLGPQGEGRYVPGIRLALALGTVFSGAACIFKVRRVLDRTLAALGESRVIRNVPNASSNNPDRIYNPLTAKHWFDNPDTFQLPDGAVVLLATQEKDKIMVQCWHKDGKKTSIPFITDRAGKVNTQACSYDSRDTFVQSAQQALETEFKGIDWRAPRWEVRRCP